MPIEINEGAMRQLESARSCAQEHQLWNPLCTDCAEALEKRQRLVDVDKVRGYFRESPTDGLVVARSAYRPRMESDAGLGFACLSLQLS